VNELYGEKSISFAGAKCLLCLLPPRFPAKAVNVQVNPDTKAALVVAPDNQLSLAIGKEGQNVRLAARLTGWRIDIRSEAQVEEMKHKSAVEPEESDVDTQDETEDIASSIVDSVHPARPDAAGDLPDTSAAQA